MISQTFSKKPTLFIPFIMAGHPTPAITIEAILALADLGADIIELGVPFSDPVADGPINQRAADIALQQQVTLRSVLNMVQQVREVGCVTPIIIFSYLNPILAMGVGTFAQQAQQVGANGVLIVDLPPEEGREIYLILKHHNLEIVLLVSPTTDPKRLIIYDELQPAFLYYISRLAVTGTQAALAPQLEAEVAKLRTALPNYPIAVGFGISTPEQASTVAAFADGVIVGSLLVKTLEEEGLAKLSVLAKKLATKEPLKVI